MTELRQRFDVSQYRGAEAGYIGPQVRAVQDGACPHTRMIRAELGPEVQPFLPVRPVRRELVAQRKVAAPCAPSRGHRDAHLRRFIKGEELARVMSEALDERSIYTVTLH